MRWITILLLATAGLAVRAWAQDSSGRVSVDRADDHDKFGFPIRFDAEVITLNDLVRSAGLDSVEQMGNIANERDKLLMEKLTDKVGSLYGLEVEAREVTDWIEREIAGFESEAEFYESLAQRGLTLELFRADVERKILAGRLAQLVHLGVVQQGRHLLPWDPKPSPREVRLAFENDPRRRAAGARVKWEQLTVSLTPDERRQVYARKMRDPDLTDEAIEAQLAELLAPRLDKARAALEAGRPVAEIGKELKLTVEENQAEADQLTEDNPVLAFVREAKAGQQSGLLEMSHGRYVIARVVERSQAAEMSLNDREVVDAYFRLVTGLKQAKATATLQLRALDRTVIRPASVESQLRKLVVTSLRQAHKELRALGIH